MGGGDKGSYTYWITDSIITLAGCSVDIFAIISGYLGIKKRKSYYRAIELLMILLFHSVIITGIFCFFSGAPGFRDVIKALFPSLFGRYWYITCFIPVLVFQPFINRMIFSLSIHQHRAIVLTGFFCFCVVPSLFGTDIFRFEGGFSFVWLLFCYFIGAYLRRADINFLEGENVKQRLNSPHYREKLAIIFILLFLFRLFLRNNIRDISVLLNYNWNVDLYTSPTIVLLSVVIIILFVNFLARDNAAILQSVSNVTFDVYIIHGHMWVMDRILANSDTWAERLAGIMPLPLAMLGVGILIFMICAAGGMFRVEVFKYIKIERCIKCLDRYIINIMFDEGEVESGF